LAIEHTTEPSLVPGTSYVFTDMLGSVRAITSSAGALQECYDYLPFGRMLSSADNGRSASGCHPGAPQIAVNSKASQKFTGQPRDNGTGLDHFGARFYSASLGRFTTPDSVVLTPTRKAHPHLLNRYAYANNNPLRYTDPSGMDAGPISNPTADASNPWSIYQTAPISALLGSVTFLMHNLGSDANYIAAAFGLVDLFYFSIGQPNPYNIDMIKYNSNFGIAWIFPEYDKERNKVINALSAYLGPDYSKEEIGGMLGFWRMHGGHGNYVPKEDVADKFPDFYARINVDFRIPGWNSLHLHAEKRDPDTGEIKQRTHVHVDIISGYKFSLRNIFGWSFGWMLHGIIDGGFGQTIFRGGF